METFSLKLRKIGNSKGIVIPLRYLKTLESDNDMIQVEADENGILLKSNQPKPRRGWDKAFKKMAKNNDDKLLIPDVFKDENFDQWK
ncbi:MAG: AbrB/MazE/SpoVT family DNA-binding domain-containing protein [Sphingobacteriales bacterium]|nr:AbrB/MazE/SpoVT family DNA-binding domain-containing protein [Sphingobacteriales bacterium]MBI3718297.1 AbrB/MazE/SpoVT family DNA-binding domain-containing protein [Sphingobacteriales bacterium]